MLKIIVLKLTLLLAILVALNFVYSKWFYQNDLHKHSKIIELVHAIPNNADIIYIGESSNTTHRVEDKDKRSISDMIGDYYPNLNTYDITKPASHAGIYKVLLANIPKENNVKTIIVTLNLRSFNAQWIYSNLETPLQKSLVLIKDNPPLVNRFLLSFKAYDIKTKEERKLQIKEKWKADEFNTPFEFQHKNVAAWDNWMAQKGMRNDSNKQDKARTILACHYIKAYGFQIDTLNNPRIKDFDEIVKLAHKRNWNLVFNLMAENTEKADKLVGEHLIYFMEQNALLLTERYNKRNMIVVNNLSLIEDEQFTDQQWTTEHYGEKGRAAIAKSVAEAMAQLY